MSIVYRIGENYKYPHSDKLFKLKKRVGHIFIFECGHRVTDNVFIDLIRIKTWVQVYKEPMQLSLFTSQK